MIQFRSADLTPISRLGAGQFGVVFLAEDQLHGQVAVKVIQRRPTELDLQWEHRRDALLSEGGRLKAAEHPNIVAVYDVRQTDDGSAVLLVMEYCPGGSCDEPYRAGPMSIGKVKEILVDTALGLRAIHARGMIHRDIKPANILIAENGRAKIGDFGLVADALVHGYAAAAGYLDHLALEYHTLHRTSEKTDIWALGMTAYRLLHGRAFYEALPRPVDRIPLGGYGTSLPWLSHIPGTWQRFVRKTLHDDPNLRIGDADSLFAAASKLPIVPAWECDFSGQEIRWSRMKGKRQLLVIWVRASARNNTWAAWSIPVSGLGRKMRLAGSSKSLGVRQAEIELEAFFASQEKAG